MRTSILLCVCSLLALSLACDDGDGATLLGATCQDSAECGPAGVCITSGKDGLCSYACQSSGSPGECPLGAYCDRHKVETDLVAEREMTLCFPACDADRDCRSGYKCGGVSSGPGKVCHPQ